MTTTPLPKFRGAATIALSVVVPVYKEAGNIKPFLQRTEAVMEKLGVSYEIIFALDPSSFGYTVINRLSDVQIPRNTGDFRIMSRRVVEELRRLSESHGFLRGMVAYVGFKQAAVLYNRDARLTGTGNYNRLIGSLRIGVNGLVGFSSRPLQLMSMAGFVVAALSFAIGLWYVIQKLMGFDLTPGLPTTVLVISFFSGVQLLALGVVGEYIGRIYDETKRRPMYIVDRKVNFSDPVDQSAAQAWAGRLATPSRESDCE